MSIFHPIARTAVAAVAVLVLSSGGCSKYYRVDDPSTGKVYYSQEVNQNKAGAVTLKDGRTGGKVTIQNSEIAEVSKEQYEAGRMRSGMAPASAKPAAAPVAAATAAPAAAAASSSGTSSSGASASAARPAAESSTAAPAGARPTKDDDATVAAATVAGGTAAGATAAASDHAVSAETMRQRLADGKEQIDRTLASLDDLAKASPSDVRTAYSQYSTDLDALSRHAQQTKREAEAMREARDAYFDKWNAKIADIENATIREAAEDRRSRLREAQGRIVTASGEVKDAYVPFVADLEDVRKFLAKDLSADTTAVLGPANTKAQKEGKVVKERIDVLIAELDAVEGRPAASPAAAPGLTPAPPANNNRIAQ